MDSVNRKRCHVRGTQLLAGQAVVAVHKSYIVFKHRGYCFGLSRVEYDAVYYIYQEGLPLDSKERYKTKLQVVTLLEWP